MCKHFKISVDHPMFLNINNAQILWYIENMSQDEEENFEVQLEMIEYLASFINSEAVKKAREHRRGNRIESTENIEDQIVETLFECTQSLNMEERANIFYSNAIKYYNPL